MKELKQKTVSQEALDLLDGARLRILSDLKWLGESLTGCEWQEKSGLGTMATDGKTIYHDAVAVKRFAQENALCGVILHEVIHILNGHCLRIDLKNLDQEHRQIANIAADYVTNQFIDDCAAEWEAAKGKANPIFALPKSALRSAKFGAMTYEEAYYALCQQWEKEGKPKLESGASGELMPFPEGEAGEGEVGEAKAKAAREVAIEKAMEKADKQLSRAITSKLNGDDPCDMSSVERMKKTLNYKDICWKRKMLLFCKSYNARDNYSMSRPNRRYLSGDFYLPSLRSKSMREICFVFDTSGSIDSPLFQQFLFQAHSICIQVRPQKIRLVQCDAAIHQDRIIKLHDLKEIKLLGGGGTDFQPVFEKVKSTDVMIFFTDLFGTFPKRKPSYPVLWIDWNSGFSEKVPFGEHVLLK